MFEKRFYANSKVLKPAKYMKYVQLFSSKRIKLFMVFLTLTLPVYFGFQKFNNLALTPDKNIEKCKETHDQICYKNLIMDTFNNEGLDKALAMVQTIYQGDPSFSSTCHDIGHLLGIESYKLFRDGTDFKITPDAAFCSYGFYHGFMEGLASEGDVKKARDFCEYVDAQISKETPDASLQCFHGIGHGWVNIHGERNLYGDDLGIVKRGLNLCEKVSDNDSELSRCATGVFNGVANFYVSGEYELKVKQNDPMWICKKIDAKFADPCYISMNTVLYTVSGQDLKVAAGYIATIKDDKIAEHAMINLSLPFSLSELNKPDHTEAINICRSLEGRLVIPCFQGFAFAFLEHGEPGREYERAINFCHGGLNSDEEEGCLSYVYIYLPQWYSVDKAYGICNGQGKFKDLCNSKVELGLKGLN